MRQGNTDYWTLISSGLFPASAVFVALSFLGVCDHATANVLIHLMRPTLDDPWYFSKRNTLLCVLCNKVSSLLYD